MTPSKKITIIIISFLLLIVIFALFIKLLSQPERFPSSISALKSSPLQAPNYVPHSPTLDAIFSGDHRFVATLSAQHIRVITATGDIIPARSVNAGVIQRQNPLWPYEKVAPVLNSLKTDILLINLETPLTKNCQPTVEGMVFCGNALNIEGLKSIHVDIASLANNHAGNYGIEGLQETIKLLTNNGITPIGINALVVKNIRGVKFAFLGYNDIGGKESGISWADKTTICSQIQEALQKADVIIVEYHWGTEYRNQPDQRQKDLGHFTIDCGADLVIGNHPHWTQPIEFYKGRLITYAHGNFIFDQMWSEETKKGVVGRYTFYDKKLIDVQYLPLYIQNYGQPYFMSGDQKEKVLNNMKQESIKLSDSK